ncbi:MAG: transposase [Ilumatobacter sp.]
MLAICRLVGQNYRHVVLRDGGRVVTVGVAPRQADLMKGTGFVGDRVAENSIFAILHREGHRLFPDEMFADLYESTGRRSVPPQIVATVMLLQRWFGLSDREAVAAFEFDAPLEVRVWRLGFRLSGVRAHGAGLHAGPVGEVGSAAPDL